MIDFACKKFDIEDVVKCSLGLSKSDYALLKFLSKHSTKKFDTEELSRELSLDKSTIQRGVKKLYEKDLIGRSQMNQQVGGYLFLYSIKDKKKINELILDIVNNWVKVVKDNLGKW
ncbi:MAG: MarR family transcriptional regulator [Nanoarchaeota archaeon]|nr:MarR family transcriptional regulator [Nanoarchaeota archaeon]